MRIMSDNATAWPAPDWQQAFMGPKPALTPHDAPDRFERSATSGPRRVALRTGSATALMSAEAHAIAARTCVGTVRLGDSPIEILLPLAPGETATAAYQRYVDRLAHTELFAGFDDAIRALAAFAVDSGESLTDDPRPLVGITASDPERLLPGGYRGVEAAVARVLAMGCRPVLLPPAIDVALGPHATLRAGGLLAMAALLDGAVGLGGKDIDTKLYHQKNRAARTPNFRRDRCEADLVMAALMGGRCFCFGICRSHQLWNAVLGGALVQDLVSEGFAAQSMDQEGPWGLGPGELFCIKDAQGKVVVENRVRLLPRTWLATEVPHDEILTNSLHHQAVLTPGRGLTPCATVEDPITRRTTLEATEAANALTVQFHPEYRPKDSPDGGLLELACRRAWIYRYVRELERQQRPPTTAALHAAMQQNHVAGFSAVDFQWVEQVLAPQLQRSL
jgi:putative glutamine amidotransferase